jgi:uncharacterized membrane protein YeaQ/YmgE (transglycosylase-associated protein family)
MSSEPEKKNAKLVLVSKRLAIALTLLMVVILILAVASTMHEGIPLVSLMVICVGIVGGFVGLQRRLKGLTDQDLDLLTSSYLYSFLAPFVGGILALLLYVLFISGLLAGDLFPVFSPDDSKAGPSNLTSLFAIHGDAKAYAKLIFWCFIAGFSERFVTDIIGGFEKRGTK